MFREEMSAVQQPPLGGLLEDAVRDGRRVRRTRRVWAGVSCAVVAAVAVAGFMVVPGKTAHRQTAPPGTAAPLTGPVPLLAASSTSTVIRQPAGTKSPVTDAAVVEQLARLLPRGKTSGYAGGSKAAGWYAFGQIYLDTGKGPGMIRAFVYKGGLDQQACGADYDGALKAKEEAALKLARTATQRAMIRGQFAQLAKAPRPTCRDLPAGGRAAITKNTDGTSTVSVDHGNGVVITVFTTTWLAWNGKHNPAGTIALTPQAVLKIAAYPGWGARMDTALVNKAATDHPSLPTVS
jgi:hypothetical protein